MEMAGVPIYTLRGNSGGFAIVDTYRFSSTFMTQKEFELTINTLTAITENVPNNNLSNVINKLKSVIKNEYSNYTLESGNLIIDAGPWGDTVGYKAKLNVVQKAIETNSELKIKYHDRNGEITQRVIEPHVIVLKQGLWYVFAYCQLRKDFRFFKTGRIESAIITDTKFKRRNLPDKELPINFMQENVLAKDVMLETLKKIGEI